MTTNDQAGAPQQPTRYQRVKEILNAAQGDTNPSYQGYKRFWELPLEQFLAVTIYGIRMIAPAGEADFCEDQLAAPRASGCSCCGTSSAESQEPAGDDCCGSGGDHPSAIRSPGRGAASGLIKGLKGEFPFDGGEFPRLPWGGTAVASSDILFIQAWIDDGCPATDAEAAAPSATDQGKPKIQVAHSVRLALAQGHAEHPLSSKSPNAFRHDAGALKVRKNINSLTPDELARFRHAIKVMQCYDGYANYDQRSFRYWADIHANNCQHGWEQFLSWHRLYLHNFEQQLQDIDPTVTLPYWDWPQDRDDVLKSTQDMGKKPHDNGVIPEAYCCWVDQAMLGRLKGKIPDDMWLKLQSVEGEKFNSGNRLYLKAGLTFTATQTDTLIMDELRRVNPLWNRNRWPGGDATIIFEAYPTPEDVENILQTPNFFAFASGPASNHFFGALENIHNLIHNFSGGANPNYDKFRNTEPAYGDMISAGTTARDPIFWGHHSNVDRLWAEWQALHPGAGPDDPNDILAPWPLNVGQVLNTSNFGYEYMKSSHVFETDSGMPIARFKSAQANVHPAVLAQHRQAEIQLHKVQYATSGGAFIRIFLNEPDASATTPTRGNDHFVAQVATFSGECMGGPGHCDPPPETRRKHDLRPRHRKTPGNFRIDATETIRKLAAKGDTDFQIQLVVLGIDGQPKTNTLRLDAVSLNFKD
jgi:tyrosinase